MAEVNKNIEKETDPVMLNYFQFLKSLLNKTKNAELNDPAAQ
jgi:hypothetical protein